MVFSEDNEPQSTPFKLEKDQAEGYALREIIDFSSEKFDELLKFYDKHNKNQVDVLNEVSKINVMIVTNNMLNFFESLNFGPNISEKQTKKILTDITINLSKSIKDTMLHYLNNKDLS